MQIAQTTIIYTLKKVYRSGQQVLTHVHKKSSDIDSFPMIVKQLLDKRGQLIVQSRPKRLVEYLVAGLISKQDRAEENTKNHCTINQRMLSTKIISQYFLTYFSSNQHFIVSQRWWPAPFFVRYTTKN